METKRFWRDVEPLERENDEESEWGFLCPECKGAAFAAGAYLHCPGEGRRFAKRGAIVPLLPASACRDLHDFLEAYRRVRRSEGWGGDARYYLGLPFRDGSGKHRAVWRIRSRSYGLALREIRSRLGGRILRVLELGAGNCWLASRLARLGHRVLATDVSLDAEDGLGALDRYATELPARITRAQAQMEDLPLESGQFDLVAASGAIHYARSIDRVVAEARRVLAEGGLFLVMDSPAYWTREAGAAMVADRMQAHRERFGIRPREEIQSRFLLLPDFLVTLQAAGFTVRMRFPFEGVERALRRWLAGRRGARPPALFPCIGAVKDGRP